MSKKSKYYSAANIAALNAHYNVLIGERSNGKTYSVLEIGLDRFLASGGVEQIGIIRRWDEDFVGATSAKTCFDGLVCNGDGVNVIAKKSNGRYIGVEYMGGKYILLEPGDDGKPRRSSSILGYGFSITSSEHYKSGSFPHITTILFDEFITRGRYLTDEFIQFQNLLSTIIRLRDNVTIWMCGNTVNRYGCPYFAEMGLYKVKNMHVGSIDVYQYGDSPLRVAVEFTDMPARKKASDVYFSFNNPRLKMITGQGATWEIAIYPHTPSKIRPADIVFTFYLRYEGEVLQADVIAQELGSWLHIHRKTGDIKYPDSDLVYQPEPSPRANYRQNILKKSTDLDRKIARYFFEDKVFYQDNEVGEIVNSYLNWCRHA